MVCIYTYKGVIYTDVDILKSKIGSEKKVSQSQMYDILIAAESQLMEKLPLLLKRTGHTSLENLMLDYGFTMDSKEGKIKLLMELAARWAETLVDKPQPTWWKQLINSMTEWIKKFVGKTLTENEVNELVGQFVKYGTDSTTTKSFNQFQQSLNNPNTNPVLLGTTSPDVILPIGTSGSGKSTFIKSLPQENLVVIEPDTMRVEFSKPKIIFGHPGLGKTFLRETNNDFIDVDNDYKEDHTMQKILRNYAKKTRKKEDFIEWENFITTWWNKIKNDAEKTGKQIFVSNLPILEMFPTDFDKVITMSRETFIERSKQRNDYIPGIDGTEGWKDSLDAAISNIDKSKIITTDKYLSELIKDLQGDMNDKSKDKEIYEEATKRAIQAIKQGKQVVFDTTNLTKDKRLPFIEAIKKEIPTANIQYKLMELNPELAKQRIKAQIERGENRANVSEETIDRHAESYKQMLEDIKNEPITNFDYKEEQLKKFNELQELISNNEFIQGAKLAFESSDLKDYGTLENYIDYIARISLGIIRNPTSGEFNNSVVKDIVYHGASKDFQGFIKNKKIIPKGKTKGGIWFTDFANADWVYKEEEGKVIAALINLKNPIEYKTERYFDDEYGDYLNSKPLKEGQWKDVQQLIDNKQGDGLLLDIFDATTSGDIGEFTKQQVVFEPEQIHILGSKQDIEGFKNWVSSTPQSTNDEYKLDYLINKTPIKAGVEELFDSNPELAKSVYESLGFNKNVDLSLNLLTTTERILNGTNKKLNYSSNDIITGEETLKEIKGNFNIKRDAGSRFDLYKGDTKIANFKIVTDENDFIIDDISTVRNIRRQGVITFLIRALSRSNEMKHGKTLKIRTNILKQDGKSLLDSLEKKGIGFYTTDDLFQISPTNLFAQITPQQKQQALQLYSQYLEQNPNGNIEQFKQFIDRFNKTNLEQQSENKTINQLYKENPYLEKFINSTTDKDDNISIYKVKEILDKHGEGRIVKLNKILYNAINRLWDNNVFAKNNIKIKFVDSLPEDAIGNFNRDDNEITIDKRKFLNNVANEDKDYPIFYLGYILNHEIIHYLTPKDLSLKIEYVDIALNGRFGNTFELTWEKEFGKNIKELYDIAIKELDNIEDYGFLNLAEFVAEAMSNPSFQEKLASIPYKSSKKSLWKRFVEILSAYLSLSTKKSITDTLLEAVIAETTNYITENSNIQRTYKRKSSGKTESIDIGYDFVFTTQKNIKVISDFLNFQQSLNKPNTNPILQDNQQEQIKKFKELQERLNNKEFLEGAKNAYESAPALQQFGTQEQYNDYIARVSLGIIKNPSSGEYNYTSKVKDIVYHGTDAKFDKFDKNFIKKEGVFNQQTNIKEGVPELFDSNPELANAVYEALGFNNIIRPNDKIVWGHPAIGKTTMLESNPNAFIDWDNEFNRKRDSWIASKSNTTIGTPEFKKARNEYMINYNNHKDYIAFVKEEWSKAKEKANKENKTLIASPSMLLNLFPNDFDKVITMSDKTFIDRDMKRSGGDGVNSKLWKEGINKTLQSTDKSKIIKTDKFINDLFITPQQKQQALQLYSQYLDTKKADVILPTDKIIWGHPAIGKTTAKEQKGFLDFDTDFKPLVAQKLGLPKSQQTSIGLNEWRKTTGNEEAFNTAMREVWALAKEQAKSQNKILMVSDMIFLRENQSDFDKIINVPSNVFINRATQRGDALDNLQNWKNKIDQTLKNVDSKKIITTDKYLSDLFLGSKQDIKGFKDFVTQSSTTIKPEIQKLFNSNPELVNKVYETLGIKTASIEFKIEPFGKSIDNIEIFKDGKKFGDLQIVKNNKNNTLIVSRIEIREKGFGKYIYLKLQEQYPDLELRSDSKALSNDAVNMWDSFVKKGLAIKNAEKDYTLNIQQVIQLYSQYLDTGRGDIEGFKDFVNNKKNEVVKESNNQSLQDGLQWLKQIMPDVEPLLVDGLIDNIANGKYDILNDVITLSEDFANKGVVKEEVFHRWWEKMIPNQTEVENILNEKIENREITKDCKNDFKATQGLTTTTNGTNWSIIEDLKGNSHKLGGIDLTIGEDGISFKNNNSDIKAQDGLLIPSDKNKTNNYDNEFLNNWYKNRQIQDSYIQEAFELDKPEYLKKIEKYPEVKVVDKIDNNPNITGQYNKEKNEIYLTKDAEDSTLTHEQNHYINDFESYMKTIHDNIVKNEIKPIEDITHNGVKKNYDYLSNSNEIHSRIMILREKAGFKPNEFINEEKLDNYLKTYKGDVSNIEDLLYLMKDKKSLLNMLNYMAYNSNNNTENNA